MRFRFGFGEVANKLPGLILLGLVILGILFLLAWLLDVQILWGGVLLLLLIVLGILLLIGRANKR